MTQATGSNSRMIFDEEATFGATPETPAATLAYFSDEGFAQDVGQIESGILRGNRNPTAPFSGNRSVKGSLTTELAPLGQATWLKHLLGAVATTGAGPYTHVFKIGKLPTSLCFEKQFIDLGKYFLYNGVRISSASFEFAPAGPVKVSYNFAGKKETISAASFDAAETDLGHSAWEGFDGSILEGGSAIATVTAVKLEINNDLETDKYVFGSGGYINSLPEGKVKVSGSITALFDSTTLYEKAVNRTESSLNITMSRGDGLGSESNESIEFLVPELRFGSSTPLIKDAKGILVELPFTAYYNDSTEASSLQITLTNTQATV